MNYGIDLEREVLEQSEEDWIFGATSQKCLAQIPAGQRIAYLPKGEKQNVGEEKMDCASRSPINILETKLNYLLRTKQLPYETWFKDNGYITENGFELSDAFIAILSGTTHQGNSIKAPVEAIRKNGVIPKRLLPQLNSFDDNYDKDRITGSMLALGQNFLRHLSINYEKVYREQFVVLDDVLDVAGFAWPLPINGRYPKIIAPPNHVWMNIKPQYYAFDNYIDSVDGDFIKLLSPDYNFFEYGYRIIISLPPNEQYKNILTKLLELLTNYLDILHRGLGAIFTPKQGD